MARGRWRLAPAPVRTLCQPRTQEGQPTTEQGRILRTLLIIGFSECEDPGSMSTPPEVRQFQHSHRHRLHLCCASAVSPCHQPRDGRVLSMHANWLFARGL